MTLRFSLGAIIFLAAWVEVFEGKMHLQLGRRGQLNVSNSFNFAKRVFRCGGNVSNKVSSCVNHAAKLLHNCHHHEDWVDCVCFPPLQSFGPNRSFAEFYLQPPFFLVIFVSFVIYTLFIWYKTWLDFVLHKIIKLCLVHLFHLGT